MLVRQTSKNLVRNVGAEIKWTPVCFCCFCGSSYYEPYINYQKNSSPIECSDRLLKFCEIISEMIKKNLSQVTLNPKTTIV